VKVVNFIKYHNKDGVNNGSAFVIICQCRIRPRQLHINGKGSIEGTTAGSSGVERDWTVVEIAWAMANSNSYPLSPGQSRAAPPRRADRHRRPHITAPHWP
jgi:hypothetical protein